MAFSLAIHNDRHADRQHMEHTDMSTPSPSIAAWVRTVVLSVSLTLAMSQGASAGTFTPNADTGGPGSGTASEGQLDETERAIALLGIGGSASNQVGNALNETDRAVALLELGGSGSATASGEVYYELEYEQGRPIVAEQADIDLAERAAYERAKVWPNFDLADTVAHEPSTTGAASDVPEFAMGQNRQSILLIEGKAVTNEGTVPAFAVNQNLRSIQMIEGKEATIEIAHPPSSTNAHMICVTCSSLG